MSKTVTAVLKCFVTESTSKTMKRALIFPIIAAIYLISSARSCDNGNDMDTREQHKVNRVLDSIKEEFQSESLSDEALAGTANLAENKLRDVSDYFRIVNDTLADPVFRKQAARMISSLFISGDTRLRLDPGPDNRGIPLSRLLTEGLAGKQPKDRFLIGPIRNSLMLSRTNDTLYSGQLSFQQIQPLPGPGNKGKGSDIQRTVQIFSVRTRKIFGSDTLFVWKVLLGNIE